jgi:hypothetical protein
MDKNNRHKYPSWYENDEGCLEKRCFIGLASLMNKERSYFKVEFGSDW